MTQNLVVCIKPVRRADVPLRLEESGEVRTQESPLVFNAADLSALKTALDLKTLVDARVLVLSVGGQENDEVLREALAYGADEALRIIPADHGGKEVGGVPAAGSTLAASGALTDGTAETTRLMANAAAQGMKPWRPALVLCGDRSSDCGHQAFGAYLAHALRAPFAHRVQSLAPHPEALKHLDQQKHSEPPLWSAIVRLERGYGQPLELARGAVCTVFAQGTLQARPAYASLPAWLASRRANIATLPVAPEPSQSMPSRAPASGNHTTHRTPVPRVKQRPTPPAGLNAEERIRQMVSFGEQEGGLLLGAELGAPAQVKTLMKALTDKGFV